MGCATHMMRSEGQVGLEGFETLQSDEDGVGQGVHTRTTQVGTRRMCGHTLRDGRGLMEEEEGKRDEPV